MEDDERVYAMDFDGTVFNDPREAFARAIKDGRLTRTPGARYAGDFMYMYTLEQAGGGWKDEFKNKITRRYID